MIKKEKKYIKITEQDIDSIKGQNYYFVVEPLWSMANTEGTYLQYQQSIATFTLPQRCLYAVECLIAEVNNGGFEQLFFNSAGLVWQDAYAGFSKMGCVDMVKIMDEVVELYGKQPSLNRLERQSEIEKFANGEAAKQLNELDRTFYKLGADFYDNIVRYIKEHAKSFTFEGEIEVLL